MLLPPLTFQDVSALLAVSSIFLLVTTELISSYSGRMSVELNKKRLKYAAFALGVAFLVTVAITMANIIVNLQP